MNINVNTGECFRFTFVGILYNFKAVVHVLAAVRKGDST
jgi:hypothetical protein